MMQPIAGAGQVVTTLTNKKQLAVVAPDKSLEEMFGGQVLDIFGILNTPEAFTLTAAMYRIMGARFIQREGNSTDPEVPFLWECCVGAVGHGEEMCELARHLNPKCSNGRGAFLGDEGVTKAIKMLVNNLQDIGVKPVDDVPQKFAKVKAAEALGGGEAFDMEKLRAIVGEAVAEKTNDLSDLFKQKGRANKTGGVAAMAVSPKKKAQKRPVATPLGKRGGLATNLFGGDEEEESEEEEATAAAANVENEIVKKKAAEAEARALQWEKQYAEMVAQGKAELARAREAVAAAKEEGRKEGAASTSGGGGLFGAGPAGGAGAGGASAGGLFSTPEGGAAGTATLPVKVPPLGLGGGGGIFVNPLFHAENLSGSSGSGLGASLFGGGAATTSGEQSPETAAAAAAAANVEEFMSVANQHRLNQQCPPEQEAFKAQQDAVSIQQKRDALTRIGEKEQSLAKDKKQLDLYAYEEGNPLKNLPEVLYTAKVTLVTEENATKLTTAMAWNWMLNFSNAEIQEAANIVPEVQDAWFAATQPSVRFKAALRTMNIVYTSNKYRRSLVMALALALGRKRVSEQYWAIHNADPAL